MTNGSSEPGKTSLAAIAKFTIAVACLIGFAWLVIYLLRMLNAPDIAWTRELLTTSPVAPASRL